MRDMFARDEVDAVLHDEFFGPSRNDSDPSSPAKAVPKPAQKAKSKAKPKPDHYKVICISMYTEDLARLDAKVKELKASGHRKMNRSALIRFALDHVDTSDLPRSY